MEATEREAKRIQYLTKDVIKSRNYHEAQDSGERISAILMGENGSGKTLISVSGILPVHMDSFDYRGPVTIMDKIASGDVVADRTYEKDSAFDPTMFIKWKEKTLERIQNGYFRYFGTYVLDSYTYWSRSLMYRVMQKLNKTGEAPEWGKEYSVLREDTLNALDLLKQIPCDVIMIAHLNWEQDESATNSRWRLATVGKSGPLIIGQFSEKWVARVIHKEGKVTYSLQTAPVDQYVASTRMGRGGKLKDQEEPNIKSIRAKCGWSVQDKPPLKTVAAELAI